MRPGLGRGNPSAPHSPTPTSLMRCPGVVLMAQVHSFLLGYLSGQLGLVMVPETDVTLWSQPAAGTTRRVTDAWMWGSRGNGGRDGPTFLAVVLVVVQHEAAAALALVAAEGVEALVLAAPVVLGALILVWERAEGSLRGLGKPGTAHSIPTWPPGPQPRAAALQPSKRPRPAAKQLQHPASRSGPRGGTGRLLLSRGLTHGCHHYLLPGRTGRGRKTHSDNQRCTRKTRTRESLFTHR